MRQSQVTAGAATASSFAELVTHLHKKDQIDSDNSDRHWIVRINTDASVDKVVSKFEGDILANRSDESETLRAWDEKTIDLFLEQLAIKLKNDKRSILRFSLFSDFAHSYFVQLAGASPRAVTVSPPLASAARGVAEEVAGL